MEKSSIIRPRTEGNILKRFCFNLLCSCKKRMLRNLTDPQMRKKLAVIVQLESVHGYSFSEFPMTILLFFLSFFFFFVLLREKYRTHSLRFDTKVPAVFFPPSPSFSWFTAWFVHNLMDVPLSVRCWLLVSCPFCFVFVNKIQCNKQRTAGFFSSEQLVASSTPVHEIIKAFEEKPHPESDFFCGTSKTTLLWLFHRWKTRGKILSTRFFPLCFLSVFVDSGITACSMTDTPFYFVVSWRRRRKSKVFWRKKQSVIVSRFYTPPSPPTYVHTSFTDRGNQIFSR